MVLMERFSKTDKTIKIEKVKGDLLCGSLCPLSQII